MEPYEISVFYISNDALKVFLAALEKYFEGNPRPLKEFKTRNRNLEFLASVAINPSFSNSIPLHSVLKIAAKRYKCFAIVEYPYFELDMWAGYSKVYSASFTLFSRICHRIHFFEGNESKTSELLDMLKQGETFENIKQELEIDYKGFMTIRPPGVFGIGKTAIKFDTREISTINGIEKHTLEQQGGTPYCNIEIPVTVNLLATKIEFRAVPFMQQDPVVGVCASVSLWCTSQILSEIFGLNKFSYDTITEQALYSGQIHSYPSRKDYVFGDGISLAAIVGALAYTGANVKKFSYFPSQSMFRLLTYTFVESNLPVILTYHNVNKCDYGHAVTLLGHFLPKTTDTFAETEAELSFIKEGAIPTKNTHHLIGQGIQLYYAHDDAYGPFNRIQLLNDAKANYYKKQACYKNSTNACLISTGRSLHSFNILHGLVVGFPRYVQNTPEQAILRSIRAIDAIYKGACDDSPQQSFLWRCLLVKASEFKRSLFDRGYVDEMISVYASLHLPKYIWLVEFSVCKDESEYTQKLTSERDINGEFIYDSSTPRNPYLLCYRMENIFCNMREIDPDNQKTRIQGTSYPVRCFKFEQSE